MTRAPFRLAACALLAAVLGAQERLRVNGPSPATVVLGATARVDLVVEGRSGAPETPKVPAVPGLAIQVAGPSQQSFTSIAPSGLVEQVTTTYQLLLQPQREGTFEIPAFAFKTGTRSQQVPAIKVTAVKELRGAEFGYLDVRIEKKRVYVHEPVRVRVEFGVDKSLRPMQGVAGRTRYFDFEVQAPWLTDFDGGEPLPEPDRGSDAVPVVLNQRLQFADYDGGMQRGGRTYNSFVFDKAFLPTRPGKLTLDAPMLRYDVQVREGQRGFFGEVVGGQSQNYYVYGQPIELEVLPIPEQGRPTPFFGAVGRFTLEATLDKDTVKVGGSVKLRLRIAGSGNFEFLRVPDLSVLERKGLHLLGQTEDRKADAAAVTYDLTPLQADVTEVPPIEWNFFDTTPGVEKFQSVATRALPLHVQPPDNPESLQPLPDAARKPVTPGVDDIFDLPPLDGAPVPRPVATTTAVWLAVGLPWLCVLLVRLFGALRARALADPGRARGRHALRSCLRALAAGEQPVRALAGYLADRLDVAPAAMIGPELGERLRAAGLDDAMVARVIEAIEQGVAGSYGGGGDLPAQAVRELAQQLERTPLRRLGGGAAALLLAFALSGAGHLQAQEQAGVEAYRRGDYAAAADAFAHASERIDDRRLWFARGNCLYRLGDLPRALWAYECARLGMPRDAELAANIALVRRKLDLDAGGEPFAAAVAALRDRFTAGELTWLCALATTVAALALGLCGRRNAGRWLGGIALVPALLLAVELLWLGPARPPLAIALKALPLVAEPRAGMQPVATVQPGVALVLRSGSSGEWVRVEADGRSGYAPQQDIAIVE